MAESIGLWEFISTPYPTYRTLTYEFLSTYWHDECNMLYFQLDGTRFEISGENLNLVCGFLNPDDEYGHYDYDEPWSQMTPAEKFRFEEAIYHPNRERSTKSSIINHPTLRYLQRCMGYMIFGRDEMASNINKRDNFLLYKMLNSQHFPTEVRPPDLGAQLLRHLDHITSVSSIGGQISIGGFVTRLAIVSGVLPTSGPIYRVGEEPDFLDEYYLTRSSGLIQNIGGTYFHVPYMTKTPKVPLPLPPINKEDPHTWQAHASADAPADAPPAYPQFHDADGSVMSYLVGMNIRMMEQFGELGGRVTQLETTTSSMGRHITDLHASHTQHDQSTHRRFDDVYTMNNDNHAYLQDIWAVEYQMAKFHISNNETLEVMMPDHQQRTDWNYSFEFPPRGPRPELDDS